MLNATAQEYIIHLFCQCPKLFVFKVEIQMLLLIFLNSTKDYSPIFQGDVFQSYPVL